jgi:hypothetical protein
LGSTHFVSFPGSAHAPMRLPPPLSLPLSVGSRASATRRPSPARTEPRRPCAPWPGQRPPIGPGPTVEPSRVAPPSPDPHCSLCAQPETELPEPPSISFFLREPTAPKSSNRLPLHPLLPSHPPPSSERCPSLEIGRTADAVPSHR